MIKIANSPWSKVVDLINYSDRFLILAAGLKWFGGLAGFSFRRSSDKSDPRTSPSKTGAGIECDAATILPQVEATVDDIDGMRPRTGSYVRSSDDYTHIGTLPRIFRKRKDKISKGKIISLFSKLKD